MWASAGNMVHFLTGADGCNCLECLMYIFLSSIKSITLKEERKNSEKKRIEYLVINHCMIGAQNVSVCWEHGSFLDWCCTTYTVQSIFYSFLSSIKSITLKEERKNSEKKRIEYLIINHCMIGAQNVSVCWEHGSFLDWCYTPYTVQSIFYSFLSSTIV